MEQNRCLLDVIDNPQLLQSFLESESSETTNNAAETTTTTTIAPTTTTITTQPTTTNEAPTSAPPVSINESPASSFYTTAAAATTTTYEAPITTNSSPTFTTSTSSSAALVVDAPEEAAATTNNLDHDTLAFPSLQVDGVEPEEPFNAAEQALPTTIETTTTVETTTNPGSTTNLFVDQTYDVAATINDLATSIDPTTSYLDSGHEQTQQHETTTTTPTTTSTTTDTVITTNTSSTATAATTSASNIDEQQQIVTPLATSISKFSESFSASANQNIPSSQVSTYVSAASTTAFPVLPVSHIATTTTTTTTIKTEASTTSSTTTTTPAITPTITIAATTTAATTPTITTLAATTSTTATTALTTTSIPLTTSTTTTTPATTPKTAAQKRAPRKSTTPRAPKGKKANTSTVNQTTINSTPTQGTTMQNQFTSLQSQQPIMFQTNNGCIRQPTMFGTSPSAPGPAMNTNSMTNQQSGMQSQQYSTQQVCYQPNSTVMMNRPQLSQNTSQQQQQQQQQQHPKQQQQQHLLQQSPMMQAQQPQQQQQARLASPILAGQTLAINQQNPQQNMHPTSQPMMMSRMPNQLILNRPPGQLLPGQQQFIQIQTRNGPMLLQMQPQQQTQPLNNTMIDYNSQVQQQHLQKSTEAISSAQNTPVKQTSNSTKNASSSKSSGLDLADLLLDCGILPEDRLTASQSPCSVKTSQSPSIQQINSPMPSLQQINSPMPSMDPTSIPTNSTPKPMTNYTTGQTMPQQPYRITIGPDGQMIAMQPTVYNTIQPVLTSSMGQTHLSNVPSNSIASSSPMMSIASSSSGNAITTTVNNNDNSNKKPEGKKRSRSKKSSIDKFPTLKTPKIVQQQLQQQQQKQQQMQAVTVVPMTVLVGDQNRVLAGQDMKPNVAQLDSGQQGTLAKIVTPVMQTAPLQTLVNSNMIQTSIPQNNMLASNVGLHGQAANIMISNMNNNIINNNNNNSNNDNNNSVQNTQLVSDSGINSISASSMIIQNSTANTTTSTTSQICSSGNVTTNLLQRINKSGTVESNPHISSSLMPTISLTIDTLRIDQNGLKAHDGQSQVIQTLKGIQNSNGQITTTLVLRPQPQQNQLTQVQQLARQVDIRAQSILNQLKADQNAALNSQSNKQSFLSLEDACKRLLRYHVFDTETVNETRISKVDEIFEAAAESLITRKKAIYDKYRLLILKQSMKTVPSSEEVMLEQIFVNDEHAFLKKERELFREYEAHLESLALKQARTDSNMESNDCASDYFAFGENSPKQGNQDHDATRSRDVDDWLLTDKWGESRYPSVPDSEAATAIESILNEELS